MFQGKYHLIGVIGEGTYGRVYKATKGPAGNPEDDISYAVKMIKKSPKEAERPMVTSISTLREVKLLRELKHPNIVNLTDVLVDQREGELALVFEYAEWTMRTVIDFHKRERSRIPEYTIKSMMWQALRGLQYSHENWVIHRDLKPQNMLIIGEGKHRGQVLLADFGLARIYQSPVKALGQVDKTVVTLWYRAPELLLGSFHYTTAVDIWSMGCIFADLLLADNPRVRALFPGKEEPKVNGRGAPFEKDQCEQIFSVLGLPNPGQWPDVNKLPEYKHIESWHMERGFPNRSTLMQRVPPPPGGVVVGGGGGGGGILGRRSHSAIDLLSKMLDMNPTQRINAQDALAHPYFTKEWPAPGANAVDSPGGVALRYPVPRPKPLEANVEARQSKHAASISRTSSSTGTSTTGANTIALASSHSMQRRIQGQAVSQGDAPSGVPPLGTSQRKRKISGSVIGGPKAQATSRRKL